MNNTRLALTFLLIISFSEIQAQDHLTPVKSSFGWQSRYDRLIKEILFKDAQTPVASFMISGASILVLDWKTVNNKTHYQLTHRATSGGRIWTKYQDEIFNSELWQTLDLNEPRVSVIEYKTEASDSLVQAIRGLFKIALSQTSMPRHFGLDGVTYTFSHALDIGEIWTPRAGSKMYELAKIGKALIEFTKSRSKSDSISEKPLIDQMKTLEQVLKTDRL